MDEKEHVPAPLVFIIAQILQYGMSFIFDFASHLVEEIHNWLMGISKGKVNKPFGRYSFLMYRCLFKGVSAFGKGMKLEQEKDGEKFSVQLWSANMTWEVIDAIFNQFDQNFASKMRALLVQDNPQISKPLLELVRPKDHAKVLKVSHNWRDIIPYSISTIFRVYRF